MKNKIVNSITNFIIKNKEFDELKIKTIKYGLEGLYSLVTKLFVVFIIVIFTNTIFEFLLLLIFYAMIRTYSFGLHASNSLICWIYTIIIYVGGSLIIKYLPFNNLVISIVWVGAFISFILWAPADTPKRPLIRTKQRKEQKIKTCVVAILYLLLLIFVNNSMVRASITFALINQSIMINPLTYKITKTKFNNYKSYPNKV